MELPDLTEEVIKRFGIADGTLEALKAEVQKNMQRELTATIRNKTKAAVIKELVKHNNIDVPTALIDREVDVLRKQAMARFGANTKQPVDLPRELFADEAKHRVVVGLLFNEIIETNKLEANEERVKTLIEEIATAYEDPQEVIAYYNEDKKASENLKAVALEDQVIDLLLEKAKVTEKTYSFSELMNQKPA